METWSYLILIAALFAIAALMLYAKFSSRSRGKLLHHSPGYVSPDSLDRSSPETGVTTDEEAEDRFSTPVTVEDTPSQPDLQSNSSEGVASRPVDRVKAEPVSGNHREEEEYLDELQEAAAGLAMLMRSSPVQDRTSPVIFAPEEEAAKASDQQVQQVQQVQQEETILIPAVDPDSGCDEREAVVDDEAEANVPDQSISAPEAVVDRSETEEREEMVSRDGVANAVSRGEGVVQENPVRVSLQELLGEEVAHRFSEIDESLDALESLVLGVESRLADWNQSADEGAGSDSDTWGVEEAA